MEAGKMKRNWVKIRRFIPLYLMLLPGLVYLFINNYAHGWNYYCIQEI